jgi:cytochrome P450
MRIGGSIVDVLEACSYPSIDVDPFSEAYTSDPYPAHERLRRAGPIVWLPKWRVWAVARYDQVRAILNDPATFGSGAGVGLANFRVEKPWRSPSLLLETDPPDHTVNRAIITKVLSPVALRRLRERFDSEADLFVDRLAGAGPFDAILDLAEAFPLKVFADAVGIAEEGRENLVAYGSMVFNTMGPRNDNYICAMAHADRVTAWISHACKRENLAPGGLGRDIYKAVDEGLVTAHDAGLIVRSFLSAGIDTTANGIANALVCFADNPEQWEQVREDPLLSRAAFEEVMRFESPFQTFFRTAYRDTDFAGVRIRANDKILVSIGAANRDPAKWEDPDRFDIGRKTLGHVGFGVGIHACVGQMIARMEVESLFTALATKVRRIQIVGRPIRLRHNTLRGFQSLSAEFLT